MTGLRASRVRPWIGGALLLAIVGGALLYVNSLIRIGDHTSLTQAEMLPSRRTEGGYVTSQACQKCHQEQFRSWHHSYHRTMTQAVSPESVVAPFDDVVLKAQGREYRLSRRGEEFWVNLPDPEWYLDMKAPPADRRPGLPSEPPQVDRRVIMSTGSHHMQLYWVQGPETKRLVTVPLIYLIDEARWVPRSDVFLHGPSEPYEAPLKVQAWNEVCVACHAVAGQPKLAQGVGSPETRVAELGIACEACHGPGAEHIARHEAAGTALAGAAFDAPRKPASDVADPTIINPARCDAKTSAQVCGRCHSVHSVHDQQDYWHGQGDTFRPGQPLDSTRFVLRNPRRVALEQGADPDLAQPTNPMQSAEMLSHFFWPDGMVRVSGREYNGLLETACHQRGDLSCVSCHSLHEGKPENQLGAGMDGNQACLQCHGEYESKLTEHTHHAADSEGSRCYNCHMPHTTYGLMKGIRSHTVTNPSVEESTKYGRPNACNLCHLDETLQWTGEHLTSWYGQPAPQLDEESRTTSAALRWLLRGDAGQRALTAWHFGWEPARQIAGTEWMPPFLAELLVDPYSPVRYLAHRALQQDDEFRDFAFDYVGPLPTRVQARKGALERWQRRVPLDPQKCSSELLFDPAGKLQEEPVRRLIQQRNDRRMELWE
ncbi:MAG: hypothetical protein KF708_05820 [Pirellulales bacterium]|nr:hypothetical protein [Pirellulales bacterium]